jgi:uncharacterized protein DUF2785
MSRPYQWFGFRSQAARRRRFAETGLLGPDGGVVSVAEAARTAGRLEWFAARRGSPIPPPAGAWRSAWCPSTPVALRLAGIQARMFAPLVLRCVLARAAVAPRAVPKTAAERWYAAFTAWYLTECDTRGWDDSLGRLHAVAHGADAAAAFA